jgi:S1-C subfamily serine protease
MLKRIVIGLFALIGIALTQAQAQAPAPAAAPAAPEAQYLEVQRARTDMNEARRQLEQAARTIATQVQVLPDLEHLNTDLENIHVQLLANPFFAGQTRIGATIVDSEMGALVTQVASGGGAESAGIKVGDVIQSIDGVSISTGDDPPSRELVARLREVEPGESVTLGIERAGQTLDFEVETSQGPQWVTALPRNDFVYRDLNVETPNLRLVGPGSRVFSTWSLASSPWADMELVAMSESLGRYFDTSEGLLVVHAPDDDAIDIQDGDVILSISGRTPNSPEHAIRILSSFEPGETVEFSLMRDGRRRSSEYTVPDQGNVRRLAPAGRPGGVAPVPTAD